MGEADMVQGERSPRTGEQILIMPFGGFTSFAEPQNLNQAVRFVKSATVLVDTAREDMRLLNLPPDSSSLQKGWLCQLNEHDCHTQCIVFDALPEKPIALWELRPHTEVTILDLPPPPANTVGELTG